MGELINKAFATTGKALRSEMRKNKVTIAIVAKRMIIPESRVREILNRDHVRGMLAIDYLEAILGELPPRYRAALRSMARMVNED